MPPQPTPQPAQQPAPPVKVASPTSARRTPDEPILRPADVVVQPALPAPEPNHPAAPAVIDSDEPKKKKGGVQFTEEPVSVAFVDSGIDEPGAFSRRTSMRKSSRASIRCAHMIDNSRAWV